MSQVAASSTSHTIAPPSSSTAHSSHELPYSPSARPTEADLDFCNAFWSKGQRKRAMNGTSEEPEDWGKEGVELVWNRMKTGSKALDDMRSLLKERASIEDDYAKRIAKLAKHPFGTGETAHLERAIQQAKAELEVQSKAHVDFAAFLRQQDSQIAEFVSKRENARKTTQTATEKTWKQLGNQRNHVLKAKAKYEEDAITINALHAQASLLQGRELDKAQTKLDKAQQTVLLNERDYKNYVNVLKDTTRMWNETWKAYCDISQDQEEERIDFVKCRVWDWANGISVVAMAEDEGAERLRTALEQCDAKTDVKIFVQQSSTGKSIPDPLPFVDFTQKQSANRQTYKVANFKRSSTRIPGAKQTPLAVTDFSRAFANAPEAIKQQSIPIKAAQPNGAPVTPTQEAMPEPSRFAVSPSANLRGNAERPLASTSPSKPGHAPASAFQRSPSHSIDVTSSPARYESTSSTAKENVAPSAQPPSTSNAAQHQQRHSSSRPPAAAFDDDDDPILKALEKLNTSQSQHLASPRSSADLRTRQQSVPQSNLAQSAGPSTVRPRSPSATMTQHLNQYQPQPRPSSRQGSASSSAMVNRNSLSGPPSNNQAGLGARGRSPSPQPYHPDALRPHSPAPNPQRSSSPQPGPQNGFVHPSASQQQVAQQLPSQRGPQVHQQPPSQQHVQQFNPPHPQQFGSQQFSSQQFGSQQFGSQPQLAQRPLSAAYPSGVAQSHQRMISIPPPQAFNGQPNVQNGFNARVPSPGPQAQQFAPSGPSAIPPPPSLQQSYSQQQFQSPPPTSPSAYAPMVQQGYSSGYRSSPSVVSMSSPSPYGAASPAPSQQFQPMITSPSTYAPSPSFSSTSAGSPAAGMMNRPGSTHSGVSSASYAPSPASGSQPPPNSYQQHHQRAVSAVSTRGPVRSGTGQFTADGQPIEFYVNALHDYAAATPEEFSFRAGDTIAVTKTEPDGWWHGVRVGTVSQPGEGTLFPSNFTEMIVQN